MKSHTLRPFRSERSTNGEWTGCALFRGLRPTKILRARSAAMCQLTSAPFEPSAIKSIAQRLRNREISALDLSATYLQQIEQTNKALNSFVCLNAEAVLEQAQRIDEELDQGIDRGVLAGIPIAVKDNICTEDFPTTAGSRTLLGYQSPYDATIVRSLRRAGAIIIGKTNMDEFGMGSTSESSYHDITRNPWDQSRVPGGSSGGSAVAVASQQCVASIGSDTGGSVRQPASHCGVVGLKPTYGYLSRHGLLSYASSFDCIGTLTSSVADCKILLQSLTQATERNDTTHLGPPLRCDNESQCESVNRTLHGFRIGVISQSLECGVDGDVLHSFAESVELMRALGAEVDIISCDTFTTGLPAYYVLAVSEASSNLARYDGVQEGTSAGAMSSSLSAFRAQFMGSEVKRRILMGTYTLSAGYADAYYERACEVRELVSAELNSKLLLYDALLTPVSTSIAPKLSTSLDNPLDMYTGDAMTVNVNLSGLPALVVRGRNVSNSGVSLPVGVQLIGRAFDETKLLTIGSIYERASYEKFELQQFAAKV